MIHSLSVFLKKDIQQNHILLGIYFLFLPLVGKQSGLVVFFYKVIFISLFIYDKKICT